MTYGALVAEADWRQGLWALGELVAGRLAPNHVILNAAMSACASGRQWLVALELMEAMRGWRMVPDAGRRDVDGHLKSR